MGKPSATGDDMDPEGRAGKP